MPGHLRAVCGNAGESAARSRPRRARARRGFTLLEASLATVIIGVGVLALVEAHTSFTRVNDWSTSAATANYLANEIRERMHALPRHDPVTGLYTDSNNILHGWGRETGEVAVTDLDDADDYDGLSFGEGDTFPGPIDSRGNVSVTLR